MEVKNRHTKDEEEGTDSGSSGWVSKNGRSRGWSPGGSLVIVVYKYFIVNKLSELWPVILYILEWDEEFPEWQTTLSFLHASGSSDINVLHIYLWHGATVNLTRTSGLQCLAGSFDPKIDPELLNHPTCLILLPEIHPPHHLVLESSPRSFP